MDRSGDFCIDDVAVLLSCKAADLKPFVGLRSLANGESLFDNGEIAKDLYFVKTGRLAVQKETGFEKRLQVVALLSGGAIVGEGALLEQKMRTSTVLAIENCEVIVLKAASLSQLAEKEPKLFVRLLKYCLHISSIRLDGSTKRLAQIL